MSPPTAEVETCPAQLAGVASEAIAAGCSPATPASGANKNKCSDSVREKKSGSQKGAWLLLARKQGVMTFPTTRDFYLDFCHQPRVLRLILESEGFKS